MPRDDRVNVIVTGANSGVGFGICQRLISQLVSTSPSDIEDDKLSQLHSQAKQRGIRIILACRSKQRAENAISSLTTYLHSLRNQSQIDICLQYENCDLSTVQSCKAFAETIKRGHSRIASIICNAGGGTFTGIDWIGATLQILSHPIDGVTYPNYKLQSHGSTSADHLGWVFQMNVFGHFVIVQELIPLLEAESIVQPTSILWMSSLEAAKCGYDKDADFDLVKNKRSYEASKYLTEGIAIALDESLHKQGKNVRSIIVHPGVVWSSIFYEHLGAILDLLMAVAFYLARWIGSPHHPISAFLGALSTTYALFNLERVHRDATQRYGTCCDRFGNAYIVKQQPVIEEEKDMMAYARDVLAKCDELYRRF